MVVPEIQISIKISYIDENGSRRADTSTIFYYIQSTVTTKNVFECILPNKLKEQINLDRNEYIFIHYNENNSILLLPFATSSSLPIYKEFNGVNVVPFYIHIKTYDSYLNMLNYLTPDCPVCLCRFTSSEFVRPFICRHRICNNCHQRCLQANISGCCYCRESIIV